MPKLWLKSFHVNFLIYSRHLGEIVHWFKGNITVLCPIAEVEIGFKIDHTCILSCISVYLIRHLKKMVGKNIQ